MQVIGLMRFSYLGFGGFKVEHETLEARRDYLFSPRRMEERLRILEALALPALRAQTDQDFTLVVATAEDLPQPWRNSLEALLSDIPQARILALPPGRHRKAMQAAINSARRDPGAPCLQFRHDDDDAVAVDFIARLREAALDCAGLRSRHRLVAFDFNQGWIANAGSGGLVAEPVHKPYWGIALGMAVAGGIDHSIMNFAHNRLARWMPTVTLNDADMFVRGHNGFNDSRQSGNLRQPRLGPLDAPTRQLFRRRFAIDEDRVKQVFAAPPGQAFGAGAPRARE